MGLYADRIFPFLLDRATRRYRADRKELLSRARGRVLEVGVGTGASLPDYPAGVTQLVALDPSRALLSRVGGRTGGGAPVRLLEARAEALPFGEARFDVVVASLVLCTVDDPQAAVREMRRVLRPQGRLLVLEHVRGRSERLARWQDRLDPLWRPLALGCHLNRDTRAVVEEAGLQFESVREYRHPDIPTLVAPTLRGVAAVEPERP